MFGEWRDKIGTNIDDYDEVLTWTFSLVLFWGMARIFELAANSRNKPHRHRTLRPANLTVYDTYAAIHLVASKGDHDHEGARILLPKSDDKRFCPVHWLGRLHHLRQQHAETRTSPWLFANTDGTPFTVRIFRRRIKDILSVLGYNPDHFNTHSFRISAATELFRRGVSADVIKKLGRWKGDTYEMYTRPDDMTCALWTQVIQKKPVIEELADITFLFGDEFTMTH